MRVECLMRLKFSFYDLTIFAAADTEDGLHLFSVLSNILTEVPPPSCPVTVDIVLNIDCSLDTGIFMPGSAHLHQPQVDTQFRQWEWNNTNIIRRG